MKIKQKTIGAEVSIVGTGLHTGEECRVTLKPSPVNTGVILRRIDLEEMPEIVLSNGLFVNKGRRTAMKSELAVAFEVETTEHLCAAIKGLGIDNILIEIDKAELPGLDGSAAQQTEVLLKAGVVEQECYKEVHQLKETISVETENSHLVAMPYEGGLKISYTLDYKEMSCSPQYVSMVITPETFIKEIAPARTFCMKEEAVKLQAAGFGKGANIQNTLVIDGDQPIENSFRFENELARHKVLDLIGDLTALGFDLNMHIVATKSGHFENNQLINKLKKIMKENTSLPDQLSFEQIKDLIPHRYPFLLIDKIIEMSDKKVVGIKNVTGNEPFFQGHFPEQAVMPGVLQLEAMAQAAGLIFRVKNPDKSLTPFLLTADKVKWRKKVVPGDVLRIEVDILSMKPENVPTKGKVFTTCYVGDDKVSEAEIKFILAKG